VTRRDSSYKELFGAAIVINEKFVILVSKYKRILGEVHIY